MTFGHAAIGLAIARAYERETPVLERPVRALLFASAALLPDADFLLFPGIHGSQTAFAHRGITHSLAAAAFVALLALAVARLQKAADATRLASYVFLVVASHPFADLLTTNGRGLAVLWPFTAARFHVLGVVPPAPFPPAFWTARFWPLAIWEIAFSLPLVAVALLPRRRPSS